MVNQTQQREELEARLKNDLSQTQYRYSIHDPAAEAQYRVNTADEMIAKANQFGTTQVQGYAADGQVTQIKKVGDQWVREDGKTVSEIQAGIDRESVSDIINRAQLRAKVGQTSDYEPDKKLAFADATAFLRIQNQEEQKIAAAAIASNSRDYPDYKNGLELAYSGYLRNPPKMSDVAERIYTLDREANQQTAPQERSAPTQNKQPEPQENNHTFTVMVGKKLKEFTDAEKAGAAYFAADPEKKPSVTHAENNRGRIMASTEIHGTYEDGQTRYFKSLPDVLPVDKEFQAGFYGAMEKSLRKRLQTLTKSATETKDEQTPLKLDDRLAADLERFANVNQEKAVKLWQKNAPEGMAVPAYLENPTMGQTSSKPAAKGQQPQENVIAFYDRTQEKTATSAQNTTVPTPPEQTGDSQANQSPNQAANQDVPERVAARYLRLKNQYYFQDKTLAFEDGGKKIKLETENVTVIRDAVAIAEARSWQAITVSGTDNFKQQVWREATMKGIEVVGYKPSKLEEAELLKAMAARDSKSAEPQQKPKQRDDVTTGVLLAHGADHYQHDPEKGKSYFVKLEVNGKEVTKWGADFKRAFADSQSQPQVGDTVVLSNIGKQNVNIPAQTRDEDGNTVETKKPVQKTTWRIEKEDYQSALEENAQALRTGKEIEQKIIAQMPQVAAAITAAKLGEKIAEQAHQSGVIKSEDEKAALVYLIREGLASALEKGKKITAPEVKEQGQQATIDANSVFNDRKPPVMTKEPAKPDLAQVR